MLVIRREQMNALSAQRGQDFLRRLHELLAGLPIVQARGWTSERIQQEVQVAVRSATDFHLKREVDIARMAELFCTRLGGIADAAIEPAGLNILYAYGVDPAAKLDQFGAFLDRSRAPGA